MAVIKADLEMGNLVTAQKALHQGKDDTETSILYLTESGRLAQLLGKVARSQKDYAKVIETVAKALLQHETLDRVQLQGLLP